MSTSANPYAAPSMEVPRPVEQRREMSAYGLCSSLLAPLSFYALLFSFNRLVGLNTGAQSWYWWFPANLMVMAGFGLLLLTLFSLHVAMFCGFGGNTLRLPVVWYIFWMMLYVAWMDAALTMGIAFAHPWLVVRFAAVVSGTLMVLVVVHRLARVDYLASQAGNASPDSKPNGPSPIEDTNQFQ